MKKLCANAPQSQLNPNVQGLTASSTIAIQERCRLMSLEGRDIYKLGLGQSPFPVPESVTEELRKNAFQKAYLPVKGLPELRQAVAQHHQRTFGIECSPENVLIGPGSKELMFLMQLVYNGDILIPAPSWVSYKPQAQIIGRNVVPLTTHAKDEWRLTPEQLEALCKEAPDRPRLLILNYPSNPTGRTYTRTELKALTEVAKKYKIIILSDEIYAKLNYANDHSSIVPLHPDGTIFSGGISKWCGAGGWRLGVFVVPECLRWLLDAMAAVASETFTSTSAPIQYAAIKAFQGGPEIDEYLMHSRKTLKALGDTIVKQLRAADVTVLSPQGGFYIFPDFHVHKKTLRARGITTSAELCERLLEDTGVAILPGSDFGRPPEELTARLAFVDFDGTRVLKTLASLPMDEEIGKEFLQEHCRPVLRAVELICAWLPQKPPGS
ncbi:MAG: aspartate aminotransferase [Elusimicrobia bacterium]|nr:MAG: aspartate aminotransferase [Elusimicrobiota bacterium]